MASQLQNLVRAGATIAGAVIGFVASGFNPLGALQGASIGYSLGALVTPSTVNGPRLGDLTTQNSSYGLPIPIVYGSFRIAGNVIWSSKIVEKVKKKKKKLFGVVTVAKTNVYSYYASFAVGLAEKGDSDFAIRRIWADGKVVYDAREPLLEDVPAQEINIGSIDVTIPATTRASASAEFKQYFTLYNGAEDQTADPTIAAAEGVDNTPAYRGLCYVVFKDLPLEPYYNRRPNLEFELTPSEVSTSTTFFGESLSNWTDSQIDPRNSANTHEYRYGNGAWGTLEDARAAAETALGYALADSPFCWRIANGDYSQFVELDPLQYVSLQLVFGRSGDRASGFRYSVLVTQAAFGGAVQLPSVSLPGVYLQNSSEALQAWVQYQLAVNGRTVVIQSTNAASPPSDFPADNVLGVVSYNGGTFTVTYSQVQPLAAEISVRRVPTCAGSAIEEPGTYKALSLYNESGGMVDRFPLDPVRRDDDASYDSESFWTGFYSSKVALGLMPPGLSYDPEGDGGVNTYPRLVDHACKITDNNESYTQGSAAVYVILQDLCHRAGLSEEQIDISELGPGEGGAIGVREDYVIGYAIARTMSVRDAIDPLSAYSAFDAVESNGKLKFRLRGATAVATLGYDDLSAHETGSERPSAEALTRDQEAELPRQLGVTYANGSSDYQIGKQSAQRLITRANALSNIELPMAMTDAKAAEIAERVLYCAWAERSKISLVLAPKWFVLDAGDALLLELDGETKRLRITNTDYALSGPVSIEAVTEDESYYNGGVLPIAGGGAVTTTPPTGTPSTPGDGSILDNTPGSTGFALLDIPLLASADDGAGFYAAFIATGGGWPGATLYASTDGGASYEPVADSVLSATVGALSVALPAGPSTIIDSGNVLKVTLVGSNRTLESISDTELDQFGNLAAIGVNGRWELVQFQTATLQMDGSWWLTGLTRGRYGTERFIGISLANDAFVLLDGAIEAVPFDLAQRNVSAPMKVVQEGFDEASITPFNVIWTGEQLKPLSPVNASAALASDGSITLSWQRRSRYGSELPDGDDIALGEASEAYEVEILNGMTVVRTLSVSATSASYSSAQQQADFGSAQTSLNLRVYQISASVGRGAALAAQVQVTGYLNAGGGAPPVGGASGNRVQFTFSGTFSSSDNFKLNTGDSLGRNFVYDLLGAGKTALQDYADELFSRLSADFTAPNFIVEQTGLQVTLFTGNINFVYQLSNNTTGAVLVEERQAALPIQAGSQCTAFVDLYSQVNNSFVLCPSDDARLVPGGTATFRFQIIGKTYAAKKIIGVADAGFGSVFLNVGWGVPGAGSYYFPKISDLAGAFNATVNPAYGLSASSGSIPGMTRIAVPVVNTSGSSNFQLIEGAFQFQSGSHPSGFKPLIDVLQPGLADHPAGAKQLSTVYFSVPFGSPLTAGQVFYITLNGIQYSYTIVLADEGTDITRVYDGLKPVIEASGLYAVSFYSPLNLIEVERTSINTPFTVDDAYGSFGGRFIAVRYTT